MEFKPMDARAYRGLNADQYQERRSKVLSYAEELPEDATDEQMRSIDAELGIIKDEDARREAMASLRSHKAAQVAAGAGKVVGRTGEARSGRIGGDTLGARVWNEMQERGYGRDARFQIPGVSFRAATDPQTDAGLGTAASPNYLNDMLTHVDEEIKEGFRRPLTVWDLFNHEITEKDSVAWYTEGVLEGGAAATAEAGSFANIHVAEPVRHSAELKKVTAIWKQSDEILTDAPRFVTHVNARAEHNLDMVTEDQLVGGDGKGNSITGIANASGILTDATQKAYDMAFIESLLDNRTKIRKATPNFYADTLLLADEDYDALMKLKNADDQYVLGGPVGFVYGNGVTIGRNLWNTITIVPTAALKSGTSILGAFKSGATVYEHVTGKRFDTGYDGEDFSHGLVSFRAYRRFVLAVEYPGAFCKYTVASGS